MTPELKQALETIKKRAEEEAATVAHWMIHMETLAIHGTKSRGNGSRMSGQRKRRTKMDAVEFFEEHDRMRKSFGGDCRKKYWLEEVEDDDQSND